MSEKYLLLSGRAGAGKTELLIAYANMYPGTTLIISEEYTEEHIQKRGLSHLVKVIPANNINKVNIADYSTVCIDYVELFDKAFIENLLTKIIDEDIRIIAVPQMKVSDYFVMNNIFENYNKKLMRSSDVD
jgi:predicted ATP-dependent serine protease